MFDIKREKNTYIGERQYLQQMVLRQLNGQMRKNKIRFVYVTLHKYPGLRHPLSADIVRYVIIIQDILFEEAHHIPRDIF